MSTNESRYTPSPRPTYQQPTFISYASVRRHVWGDLQSGLVGDWLYASTDKLHVLRFGLAPGRSFRHSPAYRTVFGADEVLCVLNGSMLAMNPETGEVIACERGESVFFRRNTWHHVTARGSEPLRVLEFFAPPPSTGASGAYAATRAYLDTSRYVRDELIGSLPESKDRAPSPQTLNRIARTDHSLRLAGDVVIEVIASTEQLTVAELDIPSGGQAPLLRHSGDAMIVGLDGEFMVRTWWREESMTHEIGPRDAVFLPEGTGYELLSFGHRAHAHLGVAPRFLT